MKEIKISTRIKSLRKIFGWNQSDLAKAAGVTSACINLIESEKIKNPTLDIIKKIAAGLDIPLFLLIEDYWPPSNYSIEEFYAKFGVINKLNKFNQELIFILANRISHERD